MLFSESKQLGTLSYYFLLLHKRLWPFRCESLKCPGLQTWYNHFRPPGAHRGSTPGTPGELSHACPGRGAGLALPRSLMVASDDEGDPRPLPGVTLAAAFGTGSPRPRAPGILRAGGRARCCVKESKYIGGRVDILPG